MAATRTRCTAATRRAASADGRSFPTWDTTDTSTSRTWWSRDTARSSRRSTNSSTPPGGQRPTWCSIPGGVGGILHAGVVHYAHRPGGPARGRRRALVGRLPHHLARVARWAADRGHWRRCHHHGLPQLRRGVLSSWPAIRDGVDAMIAIDDRDAEEGVRLLYRAAAGRDRRSRLARQERRPPGRSPPSCRIPGWAASGSSGARALQSACSCSAPRRDQPGRVRALPLRLTRPGHGDARGTSALLHAAAIRGSSAAASAFPPLALRLCSRPYSASPFSGYCTSAAR